MRPKVTEWSYVKLTLAAFVFAPEIRRIIDWRGSYDPHNVFSIIPTIMLLPIGLFVYNRRSALVAAGYHYAGWIWTVAFVYAFVIGVALKSIAPGIYGLGLFLLPILIGAWFLAEPEPLTRSYARLAGALLFYAAIAGIYGIVQFVVAPPWDTAWMLGLGAETFGNPEPFAIRVFSVMNGPGVYAEFTALSLILNLPNLRLSQPLKFLAILVMVAGLALSLVRVAWLAVVIGWLLFIVATPERKRAVISLINLSLAMSALAIGFFTLFPNDQLKETLTDRLASLSDVSNDPSKIARENTSQQALFSALANPLGHGLGVTGVSSSLEDPEASSQTDIPDSAIDNGFISRFVEMGYFGSVAFLAAIFVAMVQTLRNLMHYRAERDRSSATAVAACLAAQATLLLVTFSGDVYSGIGSVCFFIAFALGIKRTVPATLAGGGEVPFTRDGRSFGARSNRARHMPTS
jgi:hypothetical protein